MTKYIGFQYSDLSGGFFTFQQNNPVSEMTYCVEWDVKLYYTIPINRTTLLPTGRVRPCRC